MITTHYQEGSGKKRYRKMNKPTINKSIWVESQLFYLNELADKVKIAKEKAAAFSRIHVGYDFRLIENSYAKEAQREAFALEVTFYNEWARISAEWRKME